MLDRGLLISFYVPSAQKTHMVVIWATKMIQGLEDITEEEQGRELNLHILGKKRLRGYKTI